MSRTQVFDWFVRFKSGRVSVESDSRSGRPSTSRTDEIASTVGALVRTDRRLTVRELAEEIGISIGSCHSILTETLGMRRVSAKFVPRLLTDEQQENRVQVAADLFDNATKNPGFMNNIITGDETWVYGYDPETKAQSSHWKTPKSPRMKKAKMTRSKTKVMLLVFFDSEGVVHHEYAPQGQTINKEYYVDVLKRLRESVRRKRPEKWSTKSWMLHHDNAPSHTSHLVQSFLAKHGIPQVQQPPYSPDLAPCDFFLFPRLKKTLKGRRFDDQAAIKKNATAELLSLPRNAYKDCFEQWKHRWEKCVASQGVYFEGD